MNSGHQVGSGLFMIFKNRHLVLIAFRVNSVVAIPSVSMDSAAGFNDLTNELMQTTGRCIGDLSHTYAAYPFSILLRRNNNQRFMFNLSSSQSFFKTTNVCFVDFDHP